MSSAYTPPDPAYRQPAVPGANEELTTVNESGDAVMESTTQRAIDARGNVVERQERVIDNPSLRRANVWSRLTMTIYFLLGVVEVILGLRFIFRLLGANEGSDFVSFLYNLTYP